MKLILYLLLACAAAAFAQQPVTRILICTDAGASDAYTCSPGSDVTTYTQYPLVRLYANTLNTAAATVNIQSIGAKTIKKLRGGITVDLETGDIKAGQYVIMFYDGTNFQVLSELSGVNQQIDFVLHGGGSVLVADTSSNKKFSKACTIIEAVLDADASGSVTVTVEKAAYTTGTPSWSTISSSFLLSSARSVDDTTLSGWTTTVAADSLIRVNITGTPATIKLATVILRCN